jgi:hypothetical protein
MDDVQKVTKCRFFSLAVQPPWALASDFQFHDHFTDGRTHWTSDQLVARPLPKHKTTQTQNKHIPNTHALCEIRTHDPGFRASEDSTLLDRSATVTGLNVKYGTLAQGIPIYVCMYVCKGWA